MNICYVNKNFETVVLTKDEADKLFSENAPEDILAAGTVVWESYGDLWNTCSPFEADILVDRFNYWCGDNHYEDSWLSSMDGLEDVLYGKNAEEIFEMALYGRKHGYPNLNFDNSDEYFYFDGYGRMVSIQNFEVLDYIKGYSDFDIQEALTEYRKECSR